MRVPWLAGLAGGQKLTAAQRGFFGENGYLVLEGFFSPARAAAMKAHLDLLWRTRRDGFPYVIDVYLGEPRQQRIHFCDAADDARRVPYKLNDLHLEDRFVQDLSADPRLLAVLRQLLGAKPLPINTLMLEHGSQQPAHFDTFYMPSPTPNKMIATWIGFDPVTETNGPLFYFPGSHLVAPFLFSNGRTNAIPAEMPQAEAHIHRVSRESGLPEVRFYARPGDVLIWHAQLLHGGCPIARPGETRTSLVTHYWTDLDYPDASQQIDLGDGRAMYRRPHQVVLGKNAEEEVAAFIRGLATPDADRAAVPPGFDPHGYLLRNPDVFAGRVDPYSHYVQHGRGEGRIW